MKTSNIFLAKHFVLKVGDFGIAKILSNEKSATSTMIGTPMNFSPEVCEGRMFSFKSDIWASGCILYEIICLKQTFDGANLAALIKNIVAVSPLCRYVCACVPQSLFPLCSVYVTFAYEMHLLLSSNPIL